jgi:hypothetical protein
VAAWKTADVRRRDFFKIKNESSEVKKLQNLVEEIWTKIEKSDSEKLALQDVRLFLTFERLFTFQ